MRNASITRNTAETKITLSLEIDGSGKSEIKTGAGFLDHMLTLFAAHGGFGLEITCDGDTHVDFHHTCEDIGIVLGEAFRQALGEKRGINRYGSFLLPMDEALILVSLDISGRCGLYWEANLPFGKVGDFDTELAREFMLGLCRGMGLTLHIRQLSGENAHHIIEAMFKGLGRSLRIAASIDSAHKDEIPSTKGVL